jgi:hypothetical protein
MRNEAEGVSGIEGETPKFLLAPHDSRLAPEKFS